MERLKRFSPYCLLSRGLPALGGLLLFGLLWLLFGVLFTPSGQVLDGPWTLHKSGEHTAVTFPLNHLVSEPATVSFTTEFGPTPYDSLVILQPICHGIQVFLNHQMVFQEGSFSGKTANVWNYPKIVPLDPSLLRQQNHLELRLLALYDYGLLQPPFLAGYEQASLRITWARFWTNDVFLISMGIGLIMGIVLLMVGFSIPETRVLFLSIGLASLFSAVYLLDFQFRLSTGGLEWFSMARKLFLISGYLSVFFLLVGTERILRQRNGISKVVFPLVMGVNILLLVQPSAAATKITTDFTNVLVVAMVLVLLLLVLWKGKPRLVFSISFLAGCVFHDVWSVFTLDPQPFFVGYGVIVAVSGFGFSLVETFKKTHRQLQLTHQKSLLDPLTGAFNRGVFGEPAFPSRGVVVLVDMDDFKGLNDSFGHDAGDAVLRGFVEIAHELLRGEDAVIRMGGDEFVLFLSRCTEKQVPSIVDRVGQLFFQRFPHFGARFSYGACRVSGNLQESLKKADSLLYQMKRQKRESRGCDPHGRGKEV